MPRAKNTKELILNASLTLFSERGYDGVGIRDIAKAVGIRDSALYKHFTGKQEILNSLLERSNEDYRKAAAELNISDNLSEMTERYKIISIDNLLKISQGIFLYFAKDERVVKFRKLLTMEQFRNERIGALYKEIYYDNAIDYQMTIFKALIEAGVLIKVDPEITTIHFYAPIFLLLTYYDDNKISEAEALKKIENHVRQFGKIYYSLEVMK